MVDEKQLQKQADESSAAVDAQKDDKALEVGGLCTVSTVQNARCCRYFLQQLDLHGRSPISGTVYRAAGFALKGGSSHMCNRRNCAHYYPWNRWGYTHYLDSCMAPHHKQSPKRVP